MLASSVLSDSELLLLSSLEERVKNEVWMKPNQQDLHPSNICLGAQELQKVLQRDISTSCNPHTSFGWQLGRAPAALPTFHTIPLETAIGKTKVSPSLTPPPTGPGGFLDKSQCVPTRLILPPHTPPRAAFAA